MGSVNLRFRQVHLDFHTSAACEDVGADFDRQVFAETVKMGHVNSMPFSPSAIMASPTIPRRLARCTHI
jgi:hypothetical protein